MNSLPSYIPETTDGQYWDANHVSQHSLAFYVATSLHLQAQHFYEYR